MSIDPLIEKIAHYVVNYSSPSEEALKMAKICLADALGCAILSLQFKECRKLLGPFVPETVVPGGCRIPGLDFVLDPVSGAFTLGTMIRWLDYNDTFLAKEWAHPSDNIGGLLPLMDYLRLGYKMRDLLVAIIKAYEIQGSLALENSFNQVGIDHVILVKVAISALGTHLLGGNENQIRDALSQAFIDIGPLRAYRHAPNVGSRKSWAAGDAAARGIALALLTMRGEMGYKTPLSAPKFGLESVLFQGQPLKLTPSLGSYIIENILFKISFPAEFHAQTAIEAALLLRTQIPYIEQIQSIEVATHDAALRIIDKKGPLVNYADRDHCMQYMIALALIHGTVKAEHYNDETAKDPNIDLLRSKMTLQENPQFTKDYHDPKIRSIANSLTITLKNGKVLGPCTIEFPLGHKNRREEGMPLLFQKFKQNLDTRFPPAQVQKILFLFEDEKRFESMGVSEFVNYFK